MSRLAARAIHLIQNSELPLWVSGRFLLSWAAASGFMAMFATCPLCGRPGCVSGAGIYGLLIAPVLTFFSWRARKGHKKETNTPSKESVVSDSMGMSKRYIESCRKEFWQKVFQLELTYLVEHLKGCRDILSVGCGPATIEGELAKRGFNVTGLDVSREALNRAPEDIRTVVARAEDMPFPESSFDAAIYVASLQFTEDYREAIAKTTNVLRPKGSLVVMLLNPESEFFKTKLLDPNSYVRRIRHTDLREIEDAIAENYRIRTEYFLGVKGDAASASCATNDAVLYIISGTKKTPEVQG